MQEYPNDPKCKRFYREYHGLSLCVNIGEGGYVLAEHPNRRYTIFYYPIKGKGKFGKLFDSNYLHMNEKIILDVQDYLYDAVTFQSMEDFHLVGINIYDKNVRWEYKIIHSEDKIICMKKEKNYLICLNGNVIISGQSLKRYDHMNIEMNKEYVIDNLNDAEICIFSEI